MSEAKKVCNKCDQECPISEFRYGKSYCYPCQKRQSRDWKSRNKLYMSEYNQTYKAANREDISVYNSEYNTANRANIQKRSSANYIKRYHEDIGFKIAHCLRKRFRCVLKENKTDKGAMIILGCSLDFFKSWLQYCFEGDMSFQNHGIVWHIDHTVPCAKFNLTEDPEKLKCFHWSNMKPMYASENIKKNSNLTVKEIELHEQRLSAFLQNLPQDVAGQYTTIVINRHNYIK